MQQKFFFFFFLIEPLEVTASANDRALENQREMW